MPDANERLLLPLSANARPLPHSLIQAHWREGSPEGAEGACWRARAD